MGGLGGRLTCKISHLRGCREKSVIWVIENPKDIRIFAPKREFIKT